VLVSPSAGPSATPSAAPVLDLVLPKCWPECWALVHQVPLSAAPALALASPRAAPALALAPHPVLVLGARPSSSPQLSLSLPLVLRPVSRESPSVVCRRLGGCCQLSQLLPEADSGGREHRVKHQLVPE
jgi:hypothetical protein